MGYVETVIFRVVKFPYRKKIVAKLKTTKGPLMLTKGKGEDEEEEYEDDKEESKMEEEPPRKKGKVFITKPQK